MAEKKGVWVFLEHNEGVIAEVSLELLGKARELAEPLEAETVGVLCGYNVKDLARAAVQHGADRVLLVDHPELELYRTLPYSRAILHLARSRKPEILLIGATPNGRDLAPRLASALRCGLTADCTDLQMGEYTDRKTNTVFPHLLFQIRPAFGGNLIATIVNPHTRPQMATVREGVMRKAAVQPSRKGIVEEIKPDLEKSDLALKVLSRSTRPSTVRLKESPVIVAGGAGADDPEDFRMLRDLANLLGGEVGASRAAVDAGMISAEHQVGQTGTTVRPRLYIAAGISGAVQHRAGMDQSSKIIAINTDPDAPIFQVAHYKIVGDLSEVLPMIIQSLRGKVK